jgi:HAD superfamily hydrolase (TIGR01490 family)
MKKLAFFDFCGTLVNFQTADAYVDYVRTTDENSYMRFLERVLIILRKARLLDVINKIFKRVALEKKIKLLQLRGFTYEKLDNHAKEYYRQIIKPNLITQVIDEMKELALKGYEICLVSAGYSIYLKYFIEEHHIKHLISTDIAFSKQSSLCKGILYGRDCIDIEKTSRVKKYFENQAVDFEESCSYSDSITDLPILMLVGKGNVISRNISQSWSQKFNFKEIIWSKN